MQKHVGRRGTILKSAPTHKEGSVRTGGREDGRGQQVPGIPSEDGNIQYGKEDGWESIGAQDKDEFI